MASSNLKLLPRKMIAPKDASEPQSGETPTTVFWWNMLAQTLSLPTKEFPKPPFPHTDPNVLTWEYRAPRVLEVILEHNPTIIGLCEVDGNIFNDFLLPELRKKGYDGFWNKKFSNLHDGPALFWKVDTFSLDKKEVYQLNGKDSQIALLAHLTSSSKSLVVAVTHLKAKLGFEKLRQTQVESLLKTLATFNQWNTQAIVMGDFNDNPESDACSCMKAHDFVSAYKLTSHGSLSEAGEAPWTTWKKRENVQKHTIDYIWLQKERFKVHQLLEIPKDELLPELLPASYFPSDHLNLITVVSLK